MRPQFSSRWPINTLCRCRWYRSSFQVCGQMQRGTDIHRETSVLLSQPSICLIRRLVNAAEGRIRFHVQTESRLRHPAVETRACHVGFRTLCPVRQHKSVGRRSPGDIYPARAVSGPTTGRINPYTAFSTSALPTTRAFHPPQPPPFELTTPLQAIYVSIPHSPAVLLCNR